MSAKMKRGKLGRISGGEWGFILLATIPFIMFAYYTVGPMINAIKYSFYEYYGFIEPTPDQFVGWDNYVNILTDPNFQEAALNDLYILIGKMAMVVLLAVTFSVSLTRLKFHKAEVNVLRFLYYIPNILSIVVISKVWKYFFDMDMFTLLMGMEQPPQNGWITDYPIPILTFVASWCGIGVFMIILIAAINNISAELYEAAEVDGAGQFRQLFSITIPSVLPQVRYMLVNILISIVGSNMNFVKLLVSDGSSMVMGSYQYNIGVLTGEVSVSYAAAVMMMILTFAISFPLNQIISKKERE